MKSTCAIGCPKTVLAVLFTLGSITAAITLRIKNPKTHALPALKRIPLGTARAACIASSLICTHESKNPIAQIGERNASTKFHPIGQLLRLSTCVKT